MTTFNWNRMDRTPAGDLERRQGMMSILELSALFEKDRSIADLDRDIERGNRWAELTHDIEQHIDRLTDDAVGEGLAQEIARRHRDYLSDEKSLDDEKQAAAYVLALARALFKRKENSN